MGWEEQVYSGSAKAYRCYPLLQTTMEECGAAPLPLQVVGCIISLSKSLQSSPFKAHLLRLCDRFVCEFHPTCTVVPYQKQPSAAVAGLEYVLYIEISKAFQPKNTVKTSI